MKVVVTGATGFIGSHLVPGLLKRDYKVSAILEPGVGKNNGNVGFADGITADITKETGLEEIFKGANAVVHMAARNHVLKETARIPIAEYRRVNVEGTRNVICSASKAKVGVFTHLSSVKAMGEGGDVVFDEDSPCYPSTPYGISKLESEEVVREEASMGGIRAVILRLPMVYGPLNKGNFPRMIQWADRGLPFPLFQSDNLRSMVYVENVVAGVMMSIEKTPEGISTYILKDREDYSVRMIYSAICRELGKSPRFFPFPETLIRLGGIVSEDFRKVTGSFRVSSAKIEKELGFAPPFSLEEGIARTVQWFKRSAQ